MAQADGSIILDTKVDESGLKSGLQKLGSIGSAAMKGVTVAISAVAAGLSAAGIAAVKVGGDFETGMSKVAAISGAAGDELESLSEKAKEMGAKTKFSASEAASAFEYMAMAGWKTADMLGGIEGIMNLAAASGEDLALVSDIVTDALTAFGLQASDSAHFADILAAASSNANTNVSMMGYTFKYAAPLAGALGYSIEDTAVAIGLMANAGIKGEQAGTTLRTMFSKLTGVVEVSGDKLGDYVIEIERADGSIAPLHETLSELRKAFSGLTEAEKLSNAESLVGREAMSGLLSIVNASESDFKKLTKAVSEADGAALKMADTMQDNLQGQITILKSSLEGLGIAFYESIQTPLRDAAESAIGYVGQITDAFKSEGLSAAVEVLGNIFSEVATKAAKAAPELIEAATKTIKAFIDGLRKNLPALSAAAVDIIKSLVGGVIDVLPAWLEAGVQMLGQLALGIADSLPELIPQAVDAILTFVEGLLDNIDLLSEAAVELIVALAEGLIRAIPKLVAKAPVIIVKLAKALIESTAGLVNAGIELGKKLADAIKNTDWKAVGQKISDTIAGGFKSQINSIGEKFGIPDLYSQLQQAVLTGWDALKQACADGWNAIASFFTKTIPAWIDSIGEWFNTLPERAGEAFGRLLGKIYNWGEDVKSFIADTLPKIVDNIVGWFAQLPSRVWDWLQQALAKVKQWGVDTLAAGQQAASGFLNKVVEFFQLLPGRIYDFVSDALRRVKDWAANLVNTAKTEIPKFISTVVDLFKSLPQKVFDVGVDLVRGLWDGIKSMAGWIGDKISGFVSSLMRGFRDEAEIHSPSRRMAREFGAPLAQGIEVGFDKQAKRVFARMQATVNLETARLSEQATAGAVYRASPAQTVTNDNGVSVSVYYQGTGNEQVDARRIGREIGRATEREMRGRGLVPV